MSVLKTELTLINKAMETKTKPQVKKADFLNWLFSDPDDVENFGWDIIAEIKKTGKFSITTEELFNCQEYISDSIIIDGTGDGYEDYSPDECELID
jgi:hypothetical protein